MTTPRVWFLNLDAELELANPGREARLEHGRFTNALIGTLVPDGDEVAHPGERYNGCRAISWCPTSGVRALAERAGAVFSGTTPLPDLIARVVAREWIVRERGLVLDGASFIDREEALGPALQIESPTGRLLLRHRYGFAGKQRRICARGAPAPADKAFLRKGMAQGGVLIEPLVQVLRNLAVHGYVADELHLGRPTEASVNAGGVWVATRLSSDLRPADEAALINEARACGDALMRAGYRGPFGLDAFLYADAGQPRLAARCELNARYTMGWAVGMGDVRPDLTQDSAPWTSGSRKKPPLVP